MTSRPIGHVLSHFDRKVVKILMMSHLGILTVTKAFAVANTSVKVRLMWLKDLYHCYIESGLFVWVVTTYLLHLIDSKIFTDKSSTHVHVAYLKYLNNLDGCH